jgi:DNA-binding XRE family transcriptional regulator
MNGEVANKMKELRKKLGKTQAEFASLIGVSQRSICFWERGRSSPGKLATSNFNHFVKSLIK